MTDMTDEAVKSLLEGATPGPWRADGEPWNRIVWSSADNRVCFMAHSSGLNDARDIATSNLIAAAPDLARALLAARAERDRLRAYAQVEPSWNNMTDWSNLPDVYVTNVKCQDGIVWRIEACSVPMAIGPEVRLVLADKARADAQAAVALALEQAATQADPWDGPVTKNKIVDAQAIAAQQIKARIRALAPADGLAAVDALRAEIADLKMNMDADLRTMVREGQQLRTLAAELAAAQQREAALTKALEACVASLERVDTAEGVCCCGDSMDRHSDPMSCGHSPVDMGDYYAGQALESARAALAPTPTDPGDGWTWHERLGWIGPDGKPADPRRRG